MSLEYYFMSIFFIKIYSYCTYNLYTIIKRKCNYKIWIYNLFVIFIIFDKILSLNFSTFHVYHLIKRLQSYTYHLFD